MNLAEQNHFPALVSSPLSTVEQIPTLFTSLKQHAPAKGQRLANITEEGHEPNKDVQALYNTVTFTTNHRLIPPQLED